MRVLIAPDKFKGSLTSLQAVEAIARGVLAVDPQAELDRCPLADGGEGTAEALTRAVGGRLESFDVCGPLPGTRVQAPIGFFPDHTTAVVELATAAGLGLLPDSQRDPTRTTTFGVGELLRHAADRGVRKIILGIGGSATCDAGIGIAQGFGAAVRMQTGKILGPRDRKLTGGDLGRVLSLSPIDTRGIEFVVACDVANPLYGPDGASPVFSAQKGATPEQVDQLDRDLAKLTDRLQRHDLARSPGAGAAGGVGFGMMAFFNARVVSGADLIFDALQLDTRIARADLCITGEGRFDPQSLSGKAPIALAERCRRAGVPCVVLAGTLGDGIEPAHALGVTAAFSLIDRPTTLADALEHAAPRLQRTAEQVLRLIRMPTRARP
ncbi:MAG: glycerate kinase family protein [Tepidisphaeraceae bacterium]